MIYAIFAMVVLTCLVGVVAVVVRIKSVSSGDVKIKYYRTMSGQEVSEAITKSTRCFNNMFEVPVLFYVVGVLFVALQLTSEIATGLAWLFVGSRVLHAGVLLTYNNVLHRMLLFWLGVLSILAMWADLLMSLN